MNKRITTEKLNLRQQLILGGLVALATLATGCGNKNAFNVTPSVEAQKAPGTYVIPPKLDILLAEDDTGSTSEAYSGISSGVSSFLSTLDTEGWDYHFATVPLTTYQPIAQVVGSVYDGNNASWKSPYPGDSQMDADTITTGFFSTITAYSGFVSYSNVSNTLAGVEPGFTTIQKLFKNGVGTSNFSRPDAETIILVVGNGNDTSLINFCKRSDGVTVPCEQIGNPLCTPTATDPTGGSTTCGSTASSFNYFKSAFAGLKPNVRFYSAVANQVSTSCLGGSSKVGTRYQQMSTALAGTSYDICAAPVSAILSDVAAQLTIQRLSYKQRYLFVSQAPNPATIVVTRYTGGDASQGSVVPQDATNGWSYVGYVSKVNTISTMSPTGQEIDMNTASGYAIQLNGTGQVTGTDSASVSYKPAGASDSVSQ
jgi:hypothetical protein